MSWPWYDRLIVGAIIAMMASGPFYIVQRLDRIAKVLELANELELRKQRPDLFD